MNKNQKHEKTLERYQTDYFGKELTMVTDSKGAGIVSYLGALNTYARALGLKLEQYGLAQYILQACWENNEGIAQISQRKINKGVVVSRDKLRALLREMERQTYITKLGRADTWVGGYKKRGIGAPEYSVQGLVNALEVAHRIAKDGEFVVGGVAFTSIDQLHQIGFNFSLMGFSVDLRMKKLDTVDVHVRQGGGRTYTSRGGNV